ncbi:hypothetical protein CAEBREN_05559 [Caenorhabditis brenneri]|uniref:Uncharacterized protein n=1 Tax=Caenorhabditis brenneri TaxID=135651 RepID=G0N581_CAEBE|nr:hypothetical protein CAEBREN_05559 [Caenorhabditis brenneri]
MSAHYSDLFIMLFCFFVDRNISKHQNLYEYIIAEKLILHQGTCSTQLIFLGNSSYKYLKFSQPPTSTDQDNAGQVFFSCMSSNGLNVTMELTRDIVVWLAAQNRTRVDIIYNFGLIVLNAMDNQNRPEFLFNHLRIDLCAFDMRLVVRIGRSMSKESAEVIS